MSQVSFKTYSHGNLNYCYRSNLESIPKNLDYEKLIASVIRKIYDDCENSGIKKIAVFSDHSSGYSLITRDYIKDINYLSIDYPNIQSILNLIENIETPTALIYCGQPHLRKNDGIKDLVLNAKQLNNTIEHQFYEVLLNSFKQKLIDRRSLETNHFQNEIVAFEKSERKFLTFPSVEQQFRNAIIAYSRRKNLSFNLFEHERVLQGWGFFSGFFYPISASQNNNLKRIFRRSFIFNPDTTNEQNVFSELAQQIVAVVSIAGLQHIDDVIINVPEFAAAAELENNIINCNNELFAGAKFLKEENLLGWNPVVNILNMLTDFQKNGLVVDFLRYPHIELIFSVI